MSQLFLNTISNGDSGDATPVMTNFNTLKNRINLGLESDNIAANAVNGSHINLGAYTFKLSKGADVASASTITLGNDGNYFDITGVTTITSITAKTAGTVVQLQFDDILTVTDGSNLKLAGNFVTAAESTLTLVTDGTNWFELSRSPIASVSAASQAEMEAATSTTVYASPGRTQFHPGVAKAWGSFNGSGTPAYTVRHNLDSSITDNGTGDYTLSITTDFSSGNYVMAASALMTGANEPIVVSIKNGTTPAAGSINIKVGFGAFTAADATIINVVFFGDQ